MVLIRVKQNDWQYQSILQKRIYTYQYFQNTRSFSDFVQKTVVINGKPCASDQLQHHVFYQNGFCNSSLFENTQCSSGSTPRRLAFCKPIKRKITSRSRKMPEFIGVISFHN